MISISTNITKSMLVTYSDLFILKFLILSWQKISLLIPLQNFGNISKQNMILNLPKRFSTRLREELLLITTVRRKIENRCQLISLMSVFYVTPIVMKSVYGKDKRWSRFSRR